MVGDWEETNKQTRLVNNEVMLKYLSSLLSQIRKGSQPNSAAELVCLFKDRGAVMTHNIVLGDYDYRKAVQLSGSNSEEYTEKIEKHKESFNPE